MMSQQVPPNNSGIPQENGVVVPGGGYVDAPSGYVPQGAGPTQYDGGGYHPSPGPQSYARYRAPMIDPIESSKLTPQLLVLLVFSGIKRYWKWSLPMGLFCALAAAGILYLALPVTHEATAQIQIRAEREHILVEATRPQGQYQDFVNTQIALIKSPNVIDKALNDPDIARLPIILKQKDDRRGWLTRQLRVANIRSSEIVTVSISTDAPESSEKIVNAVVDAYFDFTDEVEGDANRKLLNQLRQHQRTQTTLAQGYQSRIREVTLEAAKQGVTMDSEGRNSGVAQGESLQRDLVLAEAKLTALESSLRGITERINEPNNNVPMAYLMHLNPELQELNTRREALVRQREDWRRATDGASDHPRIVQLDRQIADLDKAVQNLASGSDPGGLQAIQDSFKIQEELNLYQVRNDLRFQQILVEELQRKSKQQLLNSVERAINVLDASNEQALLNRANNILEQIESRILQAQTERNAPGRITQLTRAVSTVPSLMKKVGIIGGGAVTLAFFPLLLSIAIERIKPRLYHVSQVRRAITQVLIGEIMEPPVSWIHGATFRKRLARYRESVHNWCTHLLLSDPFRSCKTLSIASVAGDDGKTFLAVQIAVAMAQMREGKVLLIDGDMRVGRLHLLFGNEEAGIGLADVLSYRNGPGEAIVESEKEPNLGLISAGQLDVSPYELLGDGRFRDLLDMLEQNFSLIIVVLPPVANAAESLIMAATTDSTLLCVRQGETVLAAMEDVYRKLVNTGASVDGIVVKDIPYYQMAGRDGGFADRLEQIRLSHLLQYAD